MGGGFFSTDTRDTLVEAIQCSGTESTLRQCTFVIQPDQQILCSHDSAVVCQGRLIITRT